MSGTGRRATVAPADYRRPSILDETGLVVRPVGQGGEDLGTYDFSKLAGPPRLVGQMAEAFAHCARARWKSDKSCLTYFNSVRYFLKEMGEHKPPIESASDISVAVWHHWMNGPGNATRRGPQVALVLREAKGLPPSTRARTTARFNTPRSPEPKDGFSRTEMKQIRDAAAFTVRTANARIGKNLELLDQWRSGNLQRGDQDWEWGAFLDHLARTGDVLRTRGGFLSPRLSVLCQLRLGSDLFEDVVIQLFPSVKEKAAAAVLLVCYEAWNVSVLAKLQVPNQWPNADRDDPDGPAVQWVETDKARRQTLRHNTNNLLDLGEDTPGWAMQQVIRMTSPVRTTLALLGTPSPLLLWSRPARGNRTFSNAATGLADGIRDWVEDARAAGADLPEGINARQLRHSAQVLHEQPRNNSQSVQEKDYLARDRGVIERSREAVAAGLEAAVAHAHATVRMRMVVNGAPGEPEDAARLAQQAGVPLLIAEQVVAGSLDTAVGACEDFEHSPFTPSGPCAVSFLMCFACPNALATARHLPRIVYLHHCLESIRSAVAGPIWASDWAEHHARVEDLVHQHTTLEGRPVLLSALSDGEREQIDRMLDRRLDP